MSGYELSAERWVSAIFRLPANKAHFTGCAFGLDPDIPALAAEADNILRLDEATLLGSLSAPGFVIRVKMLVEAVQAAGRNAPLYPPSLQTTALAFASNGIRLFPYTVGAAGLARLMSKMDQLAGVGNWESAFTLDVDHRRIAWNDFVFAAPRWNEAFESPRFGGGCLEGPGAVVAVPSIAASWQKYPNGVRFECDPSWIAGQQFRVGLYAGDAADLPVALTGKKVLVVSDFIWGFPSGDRLGVRVSSGAHVSPVT